MAFKFWEHNGYRVQEGKRPGPEDQRYFQYFFMPMEDNRQVFHYCLWIDRKMAAERYPEVQEKELESVVLKDLSAQGCSRVIEKLETDDFTSKVMLIDYEGEREVELSKLKKKL